MSNSITPAYATYGVEGYYRNHAYRNPHIARVQALMLEYLPKLDVSNVLDLACGSGEVTEMLNYTSNITGCDPFTGFDYIKRTGRPCLPYSFEQIVQLGLPEKYSLIVCSYALHLC